MEFTIWYHGPLKGGNDAAHKHELRLALESQIKEVFLKYGRVDLTKGFRRNGGMALVEVTSEEEADRLRETGVEDQYEVDVGGWTFVPILRPRDRSEPLPIELEVTLLRPGPPGDILSRGDIDNRLKNLFDALHPPQTVSSSDQPRTVYCLAEDDGQITRLSVDVQQLWEPNLNDQNEVVLLIRVSANNGLLLGRTRLLP